MQSNFMYPASRGPSIFLDKSTYLGRSKGLCSQGKFYDNMSEMIASFTIIWKSDSFKETHYGEVILFGEEGAYLFLYWGQIHSEFQKS